MKYTVHKTECVYNIFPYTVCLSLIQVQVEKEKIG